VDSAEYGSSDIAWKRVAPKLFELSNKPPDTDAAAKALHDMMYEASGKNMSMEEYAHYSQGMGMRERERRPEVSTAQKTKSPAAMRRDQRRQLKRFDRALIDPATDTRQGVQELVDSGAIWLNDEDGGVYTSVPHKSRDNERFLNAVRDWSAWQQDMINKYGNDSQAIQDRAKAMYESKLRVQRSYNTMVEPQELSDYIVNGTVPNAPAGPRR